MEKMCPHCGLKKPKTPEFFAVRSISRAGLSSWCRLCLAEIHAANRVRYRETNRKAYIRRFATEDGRSKHNQNSATWREANREYHNEASSKWRKLNPDKHAANERNRRARKKGAGGTHTAGDVDQIFSAQNGLCYYCKNTLFDYHVDHMTPLSQGGSNGPSNLCVACPSCNLKKGSRTAEQFRQEVYHR